MPEVEQGSRDRSIRLDAVLADAVAEIAKAKAMPESIVIRDLVRRGLVAYREEEELLARVRGKKVLS